MKIFVWLIGAGLCQVEKDENFTVHVSDKYLESSFLYNELQQNISLKNFKISIMNSLLEKSRSKNQSYQKECPSYV